MILLIAASIICVVSAAPAAPIQFSALNAECKFTHQCASGQICSETAALDRQADESESPPVPPRRFEPVEKQRLPVKKTCILATPGSPPHVPLLSCLRLSDCPATHVCNTTEKTCFYNATRPMHQQGVTCEKDYDCLPTYSCQSSTPNGRKADTCINDPAKPVHIPGRRCDYDFQCDAIYECVNSTCYFNVTKPIHVANIDCHFAYQCPSRNRCEKRTCYSDPKYPFHLFNLKCASEGEAEHATDRNIGSGDGKPRVPAKPEDDTKPCPLGYVCKKSTCYEEKEFEAFEKKEE